jgi:chorismate mutase
MNTLEELRKEIDLLDETILETIAKRRVLVTKIGEYKKEKGIQILDKKREEEKLANLTNKAELLAIPSSLISQIWKILYNDAYTIEK